MSGAIDSFSRTEIEAFRVIKGAVGHGVIYGFTVQMVGFGFYKAATIAALVAFASVSPVYRRPIAYLGIVVLFTGGLAFLNILPSVDALRQVTSSIFPMLSGR